MALPTLQSLATTMMKHAKIMKLKIAVVISGFEDIACITAMSLDYFSVLFVTTLSALVLLTSQLVLSPLVFVLARAVTALRQKKSTR